MVRWNRQLNGHKFEQTTGDWASLVAQRVKCLSTMQEARVRSQGQEDPLEKSMLTHSNSLALRSLWTEESGGL